MLTSILMCCVCTACYMAEDRIGSNQHDTYQCVISFTNEESLNRFRTAPPAGLSLRNVSPGFPKHNTIVQAEIESRLKFSDVLAAICKLPGVEAVSPVRKHRFSLVVEFESALTSATATKRLAKAGVSPLKLRVPGNRKESPYFEVIVETDDSLKQLLPTIRKADGVVVAELNLEYRQDQAR